MRRFLLSTAGFICIAPFSATVQAQSADPAATNMASDDMQTGIADIVVTAERRATSAQSTPIALSAVSGEALREKNIVDVESLSTNIPNLNFSRIAADAKISIRGIGYNALGPGGETRVALYLDGIYQSRNQAGLLGFYDIDRVEVLRGPQGTLYGRNAIAGTINLLTREPGNVLNGYLTGTVGDYGFIESPYKKVDEGRVLDHYRVLKVGDGGFRLGQIIYNESDAIDNVYFPQYGMISLLSMTESGNTVEIAYTSEEGMLGLPAGFPRRAESMFGKMAQRRMQHLVLGHRQRRIVIVVGREGGRPPG